MPKTWTEAASAALVISFVGFLLSFALLQTERTEIGETLRSSGFVDEPLSASVEENLIEEGSLIGMIGITVRQVLQIVIPLLITLHVLKSTRGQLQRKRAAAA